MRKKGFKHSAETRIKMSISAKGKESKLKGIRQAKTQIEKRRKSLQKGRFFSCLLCKKEFWRKPSATKKGNNKFCSKKCYQEWQKGKEKNEAFKAFCRTRTGEKSPTWKGGATTKSHKIRNSIEYKTWRKAVFERDNYTCQECGAQSSKKKYVYLNAHHLKPFAIYPELRFDIKNGQTLCRKCHYKKPKGAQIYE